ncbi:MAG TPA: four helix bundle protein [Gemmatimonadaceae bacterium]|jgi:four helix bundle protein|nr:four helix bundle protein [Gemmatimonadaceae bacterium]
MTERVRSFKDLRVWQQALILVDACYSITKRFPSDERFGLVSQIRRSAVSIPTNIAEGHGRTGAREYLRFLSIARGSLRELETLLLIACRQELLATATQVELLRQIDDIARMLHGLTRRIAASTRSGTPTVSNRPPSPPVSRDPETGDR